MRRAALVAVLFLAACSHTSPVDRAMRIVNDDSKFSTGAEAAQSFARVAAILRDDGRAEASAYAQVTAVTLLRCTAPAREEARQATLKYLRRLDDGATQPAVVRCPS